MVRRFLSVRSVIFGLALLMIIASAIPVAWAMGTPHLTEAEIMAAPQTATHRKCANRLMTDLLPAYDALRYFGGINLPGEDFQNSTQKIWVVVSYCDTIGEYEGPGVKHNVVFVTLHNAGTGETLVAGTMPRDMWAHWSSLFQDKKTPPVGDPISKKDFTVPGK